MADIKRILVPTDFSPVSDIALQYAIDMAKRLGSTIHLLHVFDDTSLGSAYAEGLSIEIPSLRERLLEEAGEGLKQAVARSEAAGVKTTNEVSVGGPGSGVIAEKAASRGTDLIVMGTHGRGAVAHLLLGSVAERVVRMAPCAVLTVRDTSRVADALAAEGAAAWHTVLSPP